MEDGGWRMEDGAIPTSARCEFRLSTFALRIASCELHAWKRSTPGTTKIGLHSALDNVESVGRGK